MESIDRLRDEIESARKSVSIASWVAKKLLDIADAIEREHKQVLHDAVNKAHADGERNALRQERSASEDYRRGLEDGRTEGYALAHTTTKQEADAYAEMESFHDRLCRAAERRDDVTLWGVDYTALPVDADGEVIHIGELVDEKLPFGGYAAPAPIDTMELSRGASGYRWMVKLDAENRALINPKLLRHHHAPTVEDVLREFADIVRKERVELATISEDTIAEFAAKLRLAGDE